MAAAYPLTVGELRGLLEHYPADATVVTCQIKYGPPGQREVMTWNPDPVQPGVEVTRPEEPDHHVLKWTADRGQIGTGPVVLAAIEDGRPTVWTEEAMGQSPELRRVLIFSTGERIPAGAVHVVSFHDPLYTWHLYDIEAVPQ